MFAALLVSALLSAPPPGLPPGALQPPARTVDSRRLGVAMPVENPPGQRALKAFHEALERTRRGEDDPATATREDQTRVVWWGASHVAGDVFTRVVRHGLKAEYGDAGLGFVVPAEPWRSYNNRDANLRYSEGGWDSFWVSRKHRREDGRYGLGGIRFTSGDKRAWFEVETARSSPFGRDADSVEVWYEACPGCGDFQVEVDGRKVARVRTGVPRGRDPELRVWRQALRLGPHKVRVKPHGNGAVSFFGVALEADRPGVVIDTLGINGSRETDHLQWDAGLFAQQVARRDPDLVVMAYGTNAVGDDDPLDVYQRRLESVLARLRATAPRAACLFIGPSDRPIRVEGVDARGEVVTAYLARPRQGPFIAAQKRAAHRFGCAYWDFAGAMGGPLSIVSWAAADEPMAAPDHVHLTRAGYERVAQLFWDALMGPVEGARGVAYPPGRR